MFSLVVIRDNKRSNFCFRRTFQALKSLISSGFLVYYHLKYSLKSCVPQRGQGTHSFLQIHSLNLGYDLFNPCSVSK